MMGEKLRSVLIELCEELLGLDGEKRYCWLDEVEWSRKEDRLVAKLSVFKESNRSFGSVVDKRIGEIVIEIRYRKTD